MSLSRLPLATALLLAALGPSAAGAADANRTSDGAVVIRASAAKSDGIGAGTIVARNGTTIRILTAKHVATFGTLSIRFDDGSRARAHVLTTLPDRDLAIVEADVSPDLAASLHPAEIAVPAARDAVHIWGSGIDGPAFERGSVGEPGADLPDGAPHGRFAIACELCHEGDSGAGVFDDRGRLVGVYIGYFEAGSTRVEIAESTFAAATLARTMPFPTAVARAR